MEGGSEFRHEIWAHEGVWALGGIWILGWDISDTLDSQLLHDKGPFFMTITVEWDSPL